MSGFSHAVIGVQEKQDCLNAVTSSVSEELPLEGEGGEGTL